MIGCVYVSESIGTNFINTTTKILRDLKYNVNQAVNQVSEEDFFKQIDSESLSIALLLKHLAGNLMSRWKDFYTEDGEKPWRQRDKEFILEEEDTKGKIFSHWEDAWKLFFNKLRNMQDKDLTRTVQIRWTDHTVLDAIIRQLNHAAQHAGQIIFLAKHFTRENWETLSVPKGKSEEFNEQIRKELEIE